MKKSFLFVVLLGLFSCGMSDEECSITDVITNHISEDEGIPYVVFQTNIVSNDENKDGTSTIIVNYKLSEHYPSGKIVTDYWAKVKKKDNSYFVEDYGVGHK